MAGPDRHGLTSARTARGAGEVSSPCANRHPRDTMADAGCAIVSLARAFGLTTIAEGVEDEKTMTLLRAEGLDDLELGADDYEG